MPWTPYSSTDASAPVLTGATDTLNALLKACLVDGYGAKAAAGWTSPYYDATSKTRVFQSADGFCLQVADNGPGAGTFREARIRGYESMSAYNAGVGPFPTVAQAANGAAVRKSATVDATARPWNLYADGTFFIVLVDTGDSPGNLYGGMFGRFMPDKLGDAWCQIIGARTIENNGSGAYETVTARVTAVAATVSGVYIARGVTGSAAVGAVPGGLRSDVGLSSTGISGQSGLVYPDPATGGLRIDRVFVSEAGTPRGYVRGLWQPLHARPLSHLAVETFTDGAVSRTLRAFNMAGNGQILVEESDTVDL